MSLSRMDLARLGPVLCAGALASACVRAPLTGACPELQEGDLAITEIRGEQTGSYRQWIELYNASDAPLALGGLTVAFVPFDGSAPTDFFVRDGDLVVEPGAYVVLGGAGDEDLDYVDYDYTRDFHSDADPSSPKSLPYGFYELSSCGEVVERVRVALLPGEGTLFWPGEPDAAANDDAGWCVDDFTVVNTGVGVRGTPGEANPPCP